MIKYLFFIILLLMTCCCKQTIQIDSELQTTDLWNKIFASTVNFRIYADNIGKDHLRWGSATCIKIGQVESVTGLVDGHDLTNKHVYIFLTAKHLTSRETTFRPSVFIDPIDVDERFAIALHNRDINGQILSEFVLKEGNGNIFIIITDQNFDMALVVVVTDQQLNIKAANLAHSTYQHQLGECIVATMCVAMPMPKFSKGMISLMIDSMLIIDMPVGGGASGGGIYNKKGQLIGMNFALYTEFMAIAIPISKIHIFLQKYGLNLEE